MEKWIKNQINKYKATDDGRIISYCGVKPIELKQFKSKNGYRCVSLYIPGTTRRIYTVHTLILETFIPKPHPYALASFKDHNKDNCKLSNLQWRDSLVDIHKDKGVRWGKYKIDVALYDSDEIKVTKFINLQELADFLKVNKYIVKRALNSGEILKNKYTLKRL